MRRAGGARAAPARKQMSTAATKKRACAREEIAAYLDGELGPAPSAELEEHLLECPACEEELRMQRRLLSELDSALADDVCLEMPENFAQVVAARAQSDLRGVRDPAERARALRLCALLAAASFALLGGAAIGESVLAPLRALWAGAAALLSFVGRALFDAGAGVAVISRGVGGHLLFGQRPLGLLAILLFASAAIMLRRMIMGYHRSRAAEVK